MSYNIFLDDIRYPMGTKHVELPLVPWTIVRSFNEFVRVIKERGLPKLITFDHDLAADHYPQTSNEMSVDHQIKYDVLTEKTGYHCAIWLIEYCMDKGYRLPEFMVHSMNPAGKRNIIQVLDRFRDYQNEQTEKGFVWKQI